VDGSNPTPRHKPAEGPYFLYVCSDVQRRKNIPFTIRAFSRFLDKTNASHRLIVVGGGTDRLDAMISENAGKWRTRVKGAGRVSDEEISALYGSADAGLFLSLYEGFGLPLLEYMRYGVPVISSNATSLPEVAGDAALLVDPFSEEEAAEAMVRISANRTLRDELVAKGRARVAEFSWDRSTEELATIFNSILA
jgi:glycosyltransferase involved in cell wall biosynthesis